MSRKIYFYFLYSIHSVQYSIGVVNIDNVYKYIDVRMFACDREHVNINIHFKRKMVVVRFLFFKINK